MGQFAEPSDAVSTQEIVTEQVPHEHHRWDKTDLIVEPTLPATAPRTSHQTHLQILLKLLASDGRN